MAERRSGRHDVSVHTTTYQRRGSFSSRLSTRRSPLQKLASLLVDHLTPLRLVLCAAGLLVVCAIAIPAIVSASAAPEQPVAQQPQTQESSPQSEVNVAAMPRTASLDVPAVQQNPELPTGCESMALTNALLSLGFNLEKTEIADNWLPKSEDDFVTAFMGDPHSEDGHSCMAPCIVQTATDYLSAQGSSLQAVNLTGSTFEEVLAQVGNGHPVLVWCTINLEDPGDSYLEAPFGDRVYELYSNSHCLVVSGYDLDAGTVQVSDSLVGQTTVSLQTLSERYYQVGSQAVTIV